jgi:predicted metal-binding membrane protein
LQAVKNGNASAFRNAIRRERIVVLGAIAALIVFAWAYTINVAMKSTAVSIAMAMPNTMGWVPEDFGYMFVMWAVMMIAMMLPSATPMILLFARVRAKRQKSGRPYAPTAAFVSGYLLAWIAASMLATALNWGLHIGGALSSMMGQVSPVIGGILLIAAGVYQWTPLKNACLDHCRSPLTFLIQNWRDGITGATMMGLHHGIYCIGCCWLLMALLFVLGVMNLVWVAILTVIVLSEKLLPQGQVVSRILGVLIIFWGGWLVTIG